MISIFNRVEILVTMDLQKQAEVRQVLSRNGIEYKLKVTDLRNTSSMPSGDRTRVGSYGEAAKYQYEYKIYVKKADKDQALYLINKQ